MKLGIITSLRASLAGLWLLQKRLWLWFTRWSHFFKWAKAILKNHLAKRLIGCFSERPCTGRSLLYVARDWGQDQKNNLDWWEGYCAKMTWAEAGWATFFGSCPLVHFGKALHWWSHLKKRCLAQLLHEPEPKLKNKPYQRGPKVPEREMCPWAISKYFGDWVPTQVLLCWSMQYGGQSANHVKRYVLDLVHCF